MAPTPTLPSVHGSASDARSAAIAASFAAQSRASPRGLAAVTKAAVVAP